MRKPKVSIVIPSMTKQLLWDCIDSIIRCTDMDAVEIIVIAQGLDVPDTNPDIKITSLPSPIGATKAYNMGMEKASGEYVILMNDDVIIISDKMGMPKGMWLNMLLDPMEADPQIGATGPFMAHCPYSNRPFLIGFCMCIRKSVLDQVGHYDEVFSPGFGEDTDLCIRIQGAGYKIMQVPTSKISVIGDKHCEGDFPIYHVGEATFKDYGPRGEELLNKNRMILRERYNSHLPQGWFGDYDMAAYYLMISAMPDGGSLLEIGCWKGRSICAVSSILKSKDIKVWIIDTFDGSDSTDMEKELHAEAKTTDIEQILKENLRTYEISDRVTVIRGKSTEVNIQVNFDLVFIDGDHTKAGADIDKWYPQVNRGGQIAGHDRLWPVVISEVLARFKDYWNKLGDNCWRMFKPRVYDCFPFYNELDRLECRLEVLKDVVDLHIMAESNLTHQGKPKNWNYKGDNKKVKHLEFIADPTAGSWEIERGQRDFCRENLPKDIRDQDWVIVSDLDEIPNPQTIQYLIDTYQFGFFQLMMDFYIYNLTCKVDHSWGDAKILSYREVKGKTFPEIRYTNNLPQLEKAGWHLTYWGDADLIVDKIEAFAHVECNTPEKKDKEKIREAIINRKFLFGDTENIIEVDPVVQHIHPAIMWKFHKPLENQFHRDPIMCHWPAYQKTWEMVMIQEFLRNTKLVKVLELGTSFGGTAMLWAQMVEEGGRVFCCDRNFHLTNKVYEETPWSNRITEYEGDSHDLNFIAKIHREVGMVDFIFIDGDHSYDGVKSDFYQYRDMIGPGGFIGFHDIVDSEYHRENGCYVAQFWEEIKKDYKHYEFLDGNSYWITPSESMGIGVLVMPPDHKVMGTPQRAITGKSSVTAYICTKDRYDTTLPLAISGILNQTLLPDEFVLIDDGEQKDLRDNPVYQNLFSRMDALKIKWKVLFGKQKGQVDCHQMMLKEAKHELIWRVDDDNVPEKDVLETLVSKMVDGVGAVAGLAYQQQVFPHSNGSGRIADIDSKPNYQMCEKGHDEEVEHLHNTFLFRKEAARNGYPITLSPVGHREETMFTNMMFRDGWKLIVTGECLTWHNRTPTGGIRSYNDGGMWGHDEQVYQKWLQYHNANHSNEFICVLDCGLGDHFDFLRLVLPLIRKKHPEKKIVLATCFPGVFKDENVEQVSIYDSLVWFLNGERWNIFEWMAKRNFKGHLTEAWKEYYDLTGTVE